MAFERVGLALIGMLLACAGEDRSPGTRVASGGGSGDGGGSGASGGRVGGSGGGAGRAGAGGAVPAGGAGIGGTGAGNGGATSGGSGAGTAAGGAGVAGAAGGGFAGAGGGFAGAGGGFAGGAGGERPTVTAEPGTVLVRVDTNARHQTFEGWGTSLCWWANRVGGWDEAARNAVVDAVVNPESGLGYNIFRYNIGGGDAPAHDHMDQYREMPGFSPSAGNFDFEADENQRAVLRQIVATGSELILEAFSNSPPYWMTKSGCASGSADGSNNLADDSYDAFADYLTEVVRHLRDSDGISFRTLEPLNEPYANWWRADGSQEGCHFSPSSQETLIRAVAAQLVEKGLTETRVSAADENSMDDAYDNLRGFAESTLAVIEQVNVHSYAGTARAELRELTSMLGKRLWQSESGPLSQELSDDTHAALFMAGRIITDLRELEPAAWLDWQVGDSSRYWASVWLNDAGQSFMPLKRFYMHAGFSRFIRPGAVFVDVDNPDMVAAVSADQRSLALVVRNGDMSETRRFTFDLTKLPSVGASAGAYRTSRTEDLDTLEPIAIENFRFVVAIPAYSVTTYVIPMP
jgi:O-glycosyl hydrolase